MGATRLSGAFIEFPEIPTPSNPATDVGKLYCKDLGSVTTLFFRDDAGVETDLLAGGGGEVNTSSNVGTGEGLALAKVGVDLPFKSLIGEASRIILTGNADDVTFTIGTDIVTLNDTQTLLLKTLTTPTIGSFVNATHDHQAAAGGGTLLSTTALSDTADIAYLNTTNTFAAGNLNTFAHDATNPGLAVLPIAGNPSARADGAIWLNVSTQQLFARINGVDVDLGAGAGGGEANTISSLGGGTVLTAAVPKSGVQLQTVSIATTAPIAHSVTADLLTFTLNALVNADISGSAAIVLTKLQNIATARLLGRQTAASGVIEEISLNTTLELVATTTLQRAALTGDVTAPAGSNATTVANVAAGAYAAGSIVTGDISATAAIVETQLSVAVGVSGTVLTSNGVGVAPTYQTGGAGDMVLADIQVVTGLKTFNDTRFALRNVADTFSASFVNTITADRIITIPDAAGTMIITGLANQITNTELTAGAFVKITGVGTIASGTWQGTVVASAFLDADTMHLSVAQTVTAAKTFESTFLVLRNPADTFSTTIVNAAVGSNLNLSMPLITVADTLLARILAQTVQNKTLDSTNTIQAGAYGALSIVDADISATAEINVTKLLDGTPGQFIRTDSAGTGVEWTDDIFTINFIIDGGGSAITTGKKGTIVVDFNCEVLSWTLVGLPAGAIVVDVNRSTFAGFPSTTSITGADTPTIVATNDTGQDTTISWSTIAAGDILEFEVDSVATIERVTVSLKCRKTG